MNRDFTQEALDEYMSTGIDPTGGELGPDFDPEEEGKIPITTPPSSSRKSGLSGTAMIYLLVGAILIVLLAVDAVVKHNRDKASKEQSVRKEAYQNELQKRRDLDFELQKTIDDAITQSEADKEAAYERVKNILKSGAGLYGEGYRPAASSGAFGAPQNALPSRGTAYGDGYWNGYEEGFDDADGHNSYGFKYNESGGKYSGRANSEYIRGYRKGYKEGWAEGIEQLQDRIDNGDDELDE